MVSIKVTGIIEMNRKLSETSERMKNLIKPLKEARLHMLGSINRNFQQSGRPTRWKPLAKSTLKQKVMRLGLSSKPLIRSGARGGLQTSITGRVQRNKLIMGTIKIYAAIHQFGGQAGRNHAARIPARPYLVFQKEDLKKIRDEIMRYIRAGR